MRELWTQFGALSWPTRLVGGSLIVMVIVVFAAAALTDGDESGRQSNPPARESEAPTPKSGFDKADFPSYDGADLSGYARFLAEEDAANCTQSFVSRVRRFAADTFTYQPLVYPEDTEEFIGHLKRHCAAEGMPIR